MKKVIRLTEKDLTRIVKRTIREIKFSDDEEFDSENEITPYGVCSNMEYLIYNDYATGLITKEFAIKILNDYKSTASRYLRKELISSKEYQKISDCYEESMSELENPEYNKLNEMEDKEDENDLGMTQQGENSYKKQFEDLLKEVIDFVGDSEQVYLGLFGYLDQRYEDYKYDKME